MKKGALFIILGIFLFFADRVAKLLFSEENFLITPTKNAGVLFGLFKGYNLFFIFVSLIILVLIVLVFIAKRKFNQLSLVFIFAGILSNLTDRIFFGYTIDFIDLGFWPIFNLADVFIVIGAVILILSIFKQQAKQK